MAHKVPQGIEFLQAEVELEKAFCCELRYATVHFVQLLLEVTGNLQEQDSKNHSGGGGNPQAVFHFLFGQGHMG